MAPQCRQERALRFCFHAFRNYRQAHRLAKRNDRLRDGTTERILQNVVYESAIDFDLVQRQALEICH
jgi:hypothetical protein